MSETRKLLKEVKKKRTSSVIKRYNKSLRTDLCPYRRVLRKIWKMLKGK